VTIALSRAELASLTGKVRPSAQARVLDGLRIPYKRRPDGPRKKPGTLLVLRVHVDPRARPFEVSATLADEPQVQP
jgi:hypothetical protein